MQDMDEGHYAAVLDRLKQLSGLNDGQIATAVGLDRRKIMRYRTGQQELTVRAGDALARLFGVPYDIWSKDLDEVAQIAIDAKVYTLTDKDLLGSTWCLDLPAAA